MDVSRHLPLAATAAWLIMSSASAQTRDGPFGYAISPDPSARELEVYVWEGDGPALEVEGGARVDYFLVEPQTIRVRPGERYSLRNLRIRAHGLHGEVFAGAPLSLTLEAPEGVIDLEGFAGEERTLLALAPGIGRLWIESLVPRGTGMGELYRLPVVIIVR